jgi:hypothetical protein
MLLLPELVTDVVGVLGVTSVRTTLLLVEIEFPSLSTAVQTTVAGVALVLLTHAAQAAPGIRTAPPTAAAPVATTPLKMLRERTVDPRRAF